MPSRSELIRPAHPSLSLAGCYALAGTVAALADLGVAVAYWSQRGVAPDRIFQSIASWVMGPAAFAGGEATVVIGALLYAVVLTGVLAGYRALLRRAVRPPRHPLAAGALYGAVMYMLIFLVLVPHASAATPATHPLPWHAICVAAYALLVGIPAALLARIAPP